MQSRKPAWWQLYILVPIMLGLTIVEARVPLPGMSPNIVDSLIVLLTFGGMFVWVQINLGVVERAEMERDATLNELKITVYKPLAQSGGGESDAAISARRKILSPTAGFTEQKDDAKWYLN